MPYARSPCSSGRHEENQEEPVQLDDAWPRAVPDYRLAPSAICRAVLSDRAQAGPLLEPPVGPVCDGLTFSEIGHCVRIMTCHYQKIDGFQPGS
jgi:hypothetical protein